MIIAIFFFPTTLSYDARTFIVVENLNVTIHIVFLLHARVIKGTSCFYNIKKKENFGGIHHHVLFDIIVGEK